MAKKIGIGDLAAAVEKILNDYGEKVGEMTNESINKAGNEARKTLRSVSPKRSGKYAAGWQHKENISRVGHIEIVVYNGGSHGSFTQLLEKGHVKRDGTGWIAGKPHIGPVNDETQKAVLKYIEDGIGNIKV